MKCKFKTFFCTIVLKLFLVLLFSVFVAAVVFVESLELPNNVQEAINTHLLPAVNKVESWVAEKLTPESAKKLRTAIHKDLLLLRQKVSPENITKLEDRIMVFITSPLNMVTSVHNLIASQKNSTS